MTRKKAAPEAAAEEPEESSEAPVQEAEPEAAAEEAADPAASVVKLVAKARVLETEELLAQLLDLPADAPLEFDASAVENVSTPYILAVVAAARGRAAAGGAVSVRSPSAGFVDAFSDLGLFSDLMKMEIRP